MGPATPSTGSSGSGRTLSTVAGYVDASVLLAALKETADDVRAHLAGHRYAAVDPVFVVGEGRKFCGAVPLATLLAAPGETPVESLILPDWPSVVVDDSCEDAGSLAIRRNAPALAVLDHTGAFLGGLTATAVMAILRREHFEDLHHMAGILVRSDQAKAALRAAPHRRALYRLPWLLVGLAGSAGATALMAGSEAALASNIAIAFFVPAIVYLADAIGTQAEAVAVRGLTLSDGGTLGLLIGELGTGALLGFALGVVALGGVWVAFGEFRLAVVVALSLAFAGTIASGIGFLLPWAFQRGGLDPAYGAGPLGTVIQDVLSIAIYLALATYLLA